MSELTIMIYDSGHKELKAYLMSLKGILDVCFSVKSAQTVSRIPVIPGLG